MNYVFFDLETQNLFEDVGGRDHIDKLKVACAVTFSTAKNDFPKPPRAINRCTRYRSRSNSFVPQVTQKRLPLGFWGFWQVGFRQ